MPHEDGGVEHLKDSLYSRKQKGMQDVRAPLTHNEEEAPKAWQGEPAPRAPRPIPIAASGMGLATKFLIGSGVFFVLAIGGALIFFFSGGNYISPANIDLQIVAPSLIDGGSTANLQFIITNRNSSDLVLADLVIDYPDGTRDPKDPTQTLLHQTISVGTIAPGQQVKLTSSAVFYGSEGVAQPLKASLDYGIPGSNAVFVKESDTTVTIGSSPVSVSVDAPSQAIAGQPFTMKVTVQSNSATPVDSVLVQAQYPFGFTAQSSSPQAESGSTLWRLGTMAPGAVQVISVTGTIDGQDGDQRVFRFSSGTNQDPTAGKIAVPFLSVPVTLTVQRPFITASLAVEGNTGTKVSAPAGKPLQGSITWQNNLSDPVTDVQIKLSLSGPELDPTSIQSGNGFYQSSDSSITWTSAQDPSLATVAPGGTGTLNFTFGTLPPGTGGVVYTNPVINLSVNVGAVRAGQGNVPEQVNSAATMQVTLASAATLLAQALHFTGSFSNSGAMPPRSGSPTLYTVQWTVKNSSNTVAGVTVSTVLPTYTTFVAAAPGSAITYDAGSRTVRWSLGDLNAGVGYSSAARTGSFQVSLTPSDSQVGSAPTLTGTTALSGTDRFAQVQVTATADGPTTTLSEPGFASGMDIVQPKQ